MSYVTNLIEQYREEDPEFRAAYDEEVELFNQLQERRRKIMSLFAEARKTQKLSQREIGQRLNVSQARVSQMERGEEPMSFDRVLELASVLGLSLTITAENAASTARSAKVSP